MASLSLAAVRMGFEVGRDIAWVRFSFSGRCRPSSLQVLTEKCNGGKRNSRPMGLWWMPSRVLNVNVVGRAERDNEVDPRVNPPGSQALGLGPLTPNLELSRGQ